MFFFFKQKTAYEMRISDWSSDVCSSDLRSRLPPGARQAAGIGRGAGQPTDDEPVGKCTDYARTGQHDGRDDRHLLRQLSRPSDSGHAGYRRHVRRRAWLSTALVLERARSEEHTSELQSLMRISYAVFCLKKKKAHHHSPQHTEHATV